MTWPKLAEFSLAEAFDELFSKAEKSQFECLLNPDLLHQAKLNILHLHGNQIKLAEFL